MWRDLLKSKTQFISIFLMSLLGMLVFVGLDAESSGAAAAADAYYKKYNLCDIWIQGAGFTDDDIRTARHVTGVTDVEKRLALTGTMDVGDGEDAFTAYMYINFMGSDNINSLMVYEGDPFDGEGEGVWIQEWFARTNGIKLGDNIKLKLDSTTINGIVRGIVDAPDCVSPLQCIPIRQGSYTIS